MTDFMGFPDFFFFIAGFVCMSANGGMRSRMRAVTPALIACLLVFGCTRSCAHDAFELEDTLATPVFAFSNAGVFGGRQRVQYEVGQSLAPVTRPFTATPLLVCVIEANVGACRIRPSRRSRWDRPVRSFTPSLGRLAKCKYACTMHAGRR